MIRQAVPATLVDPKEKTRTLEEGLFLGIRLPPKRREFSLDLIRVKLDLLGSKRSAATMTLRDIPKLEERNKEKTCFRVSNY